MPRQLDIMHELYGKDWTHKCGDCSNLTVHRRYGKTQCKCKRYGDSHCEATDWWRIWKACGAYNDPLPEGWKPVKDWYRPKREPEKPVEGQMGMEMGTE